MNIFKIKEGDSYKVFREKEIVYCKASGSYTEIVLTNGRKYISSKHLKVIAGKLSNHFLRIHSGNLVNPDFIEYISKEYGNLTVSTGDELNIAQSRFKEVYNFFETI